MPIPPPVIAPPYDTVESVLNVARTRLNDAIASLGGDILTDTQPFTGAMFNSAYRKLQAYLSNLGYSTYKRKFWAYAFPVVASTDPSSECIWNWQYYYDGAAYWAPPLVGVCPQDMIAPLVMKERQTGTNQPFQPMRSAPDGLPEGYKRPWNGWFEWKNNSIYLPGSTYSMDFEVEYAAFDADFQVNGSNQIINPTTTYVPIVRSQSALANYLCAEVALGRDDVDMNAFVQAAQDDAKLMMNNSDVKLKQRHPVQRQAYAGRQRGLGWGTLRY